MPKDARSLLYGRRAGKGPIKRDRPVEILKASDSAEWSKREREAFDEYWPEKFEKFLEERWDDTATDYSNCHLAVQLVTAEKVELAFYDNNDEDGAVLRLNHQGVIGDDGLRDIYPLAGKSQRVALTVDDYWDIDIKEEPIDVVIASSEQAYRSTGSELSSRTQLIIEFVLRPAIDDLYEWLKLG